MEATDKETVRAPTESIPTGTIGYWPIVLSIVVVVLLMLGAWAGIARLYPSLDDRSAFGDMFGAVNALFSGLAFAGVIYAILMQRQELALQRRELELTRQELQRSATAQEESHKALSEQGRVMLQTARLNSLIGRIEALNKAFVLAQTGVSIFGRKDDIARELAVCVNDLRGLSESISGETRSRE